MVDSLCETKLALLGLVALVVLCLIAAASPFVAPYDPRLIVLEERLRPPAVMASAGHGHLFGTDSMGRDTLSRLMYGARISLLVGLSAVVISGSLGVVLGTLAGYYRGWLDTVLMRFADVQLAFPSIVLYIVVMAILGPGLLNIILVLGFNGWVSYGRIARGQAMSCREREYVQAAKAVGCRDLRIMTRHVLPNSLAPLIVIATTSVASNIIAEASLSFLGLGVPPSVPTWGSMLAESRDYIRTAWWLAAFPGLVLTLTVLSINLVGDWLRDYLDPTLHP